MNAMPRQQYGLGSFVKKAVKGVTGAAKSAAKGITGAVKDVAGSDLGKLAILAATYKLGGGKLLGGEGFKFGNLPGASFFGKGSYNPFLRTVAGDTAFSTLGQIGSNLGLVNSAGGLSTLGKVAGVSAFGGLTGYLAQQGMEEEEIEAIKQNPTALRGYLAQYYSNLNPSANPREVDAFVETNMSEYSTPFATGGRAGFANGNEARTLTYEEAKAMNPSMFMDTTTSAYGDAGEGRPVPRYFEDKMQTLVEAKGGMSPRSRIALFKQYLDEALQTGQISQEKYQRMLMPFFGAGGEKVTQEIEAYGRGEKAYGGRMQYAFGSPEGNAIQASGIEGIPLNVNPAGATELDMRETGGFVPPVGVKEKADDIPAMLSNNEFVMTAKLLENLETETLTKVQIECTL